MGRHLFVSCAALLGLAFVATSPSAADIVPGVRDAYPTAIRVSLTTDRASYALRDTVKVRIEFKNTSTEALSLPHPAGPVMDVALKIVDAAGVPVAPDRHIQLHVAGWFSGHSIFIDPGEVIVEKSEGHEFIPISYWGYDITTPGVYRLTAVLQGSGSSSNMVTLTVGR